MKCPSLILLWIFFLTGCAPRYTTTYVLILDEAPGIERLAESKMTRRGMIFDDAFPVEYVLQRDAYVIHFIINPDRSGAHIYLLPFSDKEKESELELVEVRGGLSCGAIRAKPLQNVKMPTHNYYEYIWGIYKKNCDSIEYKEEREMDSIIRFQVINNKGDVLGQENIAYKLVKNGKSFSFFSP